jgi:8-oxo-dGTP pyrophosphatase MutT (NUDIX family)
MTQTPAPIRPAATVLILRDRPDGLEVLMIQRAASMAFAANACAFPGGGVHVADRDPAWAPSDDADDHAHRIAALREAFEETGVLLVEGAWRPDRVALAAARPTIAADAALFRPWLTEQALRLDIAGLTPFSRWIPPETTPRRYDTRFYLAVADPEEAVLVDGSETQDAFWIRPAEMLAQHAAKERIVIFPTRMNLLRLARANSVAEAVAQARADGAHTINPWVEVRGGEPSLCIPEGVGYPITSLPLHDALRGEQKPISPAAETAS